MAAQRASIRNLLDANKHYYLERADRDIEAHRKGDFCVTVLENGAPIKHAEITYTMQKIDFAFGCNMFMLDQYKNKERQAAYL